MEKYNMGLPNEMFARLSDEANRLLAAETCYVARTLFPEQPAAATAKSLPVEPEPWATKLADTDLQTVPYLVIIGHAGSGKRTIVRKAFADHARRFVQSRVGPCPLRIDLGADLGPGAGLEEAIAQKWGIPWAEIQQGHEAGAALYLECLDQASQGPSAFVRRLGRFFERYQASLPQVVLTCHRGMWQEDWLKELPQRFETYHADFLDIRNYDPLFPDLDRAERFRDECNRAGVAGLLSKPFYGFNLARRYLKEQHLPKTRRGLLDRQVQDLVQTAGGPVSPDRISSDRLVSLASRLALLATFSTATDWTADSAHDLLDGDPAVRPVAHHEILTVLQSPLFWKSEDRFRFCNPLLTEFLAARAMTGLLPRQRLLLLEVERGSRRIRPAHAGVAVFLAEQAPDFWRYLSETDPNLVMKAECPFGREADEALLRGFMDRVLADRIAPRLPVDVDESETELLGRHRPADVVRFVSRYLKAQDPLAVSWGVAQAALWGSHPALNDDLKAVALEPALPPWIRAAAIKAIADAGSTAIISTLQPLLEDHDATVREAVLLAFRRLKLCSVAELVKGLLEGARNGTVTDTAIRRVIMDLSPVEWGEAQELLVQAYSEIQEQEHPPHPDGILYWLVIRAEALGLTVNPDSVLVTEKYVAHAHYRGESALIDHVRRRPELQGQVLRRVLSRVAKPAPENAELRSALVHLTDIQVARYLPAVNELTNDQGLFLVGLLGSHVDWGGANPESQYELIKQLAPAFARYVRPSEWRRYYTPEKVETSLLKALSTPDLSDRAWECLRAMAALQGRVLLPEEPMAQLRGKELAAVLSAASPDLANRVRETFLSAVGQAGFDRARREQEPAYLRLEAVFWGATAIGVEFSGETTHDLILCFGFSGRGTDWKYTELLRDLRERDLSAYAECVRHLLAADTDRAPLLTFLEGHLHDGTGGDSFAVPLCHALIESGQAQGEELRTLLRYLVVRREPGTAEYLQSLVEQALRELVAGHPSLKRLSSFFDYLMLYEQLGGWIEGREETFRGWYAQLRGGKGVCGELAYAMLLWRLGHGDAWAWEEFEQLLNEGRVPLTNEGVGAVLMSRALPDARQIDLLLKWCRQPVRKRSRHRPDESADESALVLGHFAAKGSGAAMAALRKLVGEGAIDALNLSMIEGDYLNHFEPWPPVDLLALGGVREGVPFSNRHLHEVVFAALAAIRHDCALGLLTRSFWAEDRPKNEVECQDILRGQIARDFRLQNLSTVEIPEFLVIRNRCDLMITCRDARWQVAVEMKIARETSSPGQLLDPIEQQLWAKYMKPNDCGYGLYVVLWFPDGVCVSHPGKWADAAELEADLKERCASVSDTHCVLIEPVVLDVSGPARRH